MSRAITDGKVREFGKAVRNLREHLIDPVERMTTAAEAAIVDLRAEIATLESLRPHWAKGYSSDSVAAQAKTNALAQVWDLLGVDNQTACMDRMRELVDRPTLDAYQAACRALHWRTAELRAHGIEPVAIPADAPHDPPAEAFDPCEHDPVPVIWPRIPLAFGSAEWDRCTKCGAWRTTHHVTGEWRPASTLAAALIERED